MVTLDPPKPKLVFPDKVDRSFQPGSPADQCTPEQREGAFDTFDMINGYLKLWAAELDEQNSQ